MTPDMSSMDWRGRIAVLEAERDALLSKLAEAGIALADCGTALIAAEAERDALRIDLQTADDQLRALRKENGEFRESLIGMHERAERAERAESAMNNLAVKLTASEDLVRVQYEANEEMTRLLSAAETEVERLRAALEEVRGLTKCASDVFLIQISSVAAQALHLDWRDGGVKP